MPVRNEVEFIERSLGSVLAQDYPTDKLDVVVADAMSTDGTTDLLRAFSRQDSRVRVVENPGLIAPTGLNAAMRVASGQIVIRVDGHCVVQPDYVKRCVTWIIQENVDGVGGVIDTMGQTSVAAAIAKAMSSRFGVGDSAFRVGVQSPVLSDTVPFPAYTRAVIDRLGPYDESLARNQDDEYNYRLRKAGGRLLLVPDIRTTYFSRGTLRSLWRQYFQYGYYKVKVLNMHPFQMRWRQFIPPAFVLFLSGGIVISMVSRTAAIACASVLGTYFALNIGWSVASAGFNACALVVALAFCAMHVGYGAGFVAGLIGHGCRALLRA